MVTEEYILNVYAHIWRMEGFIYIYADQPLTFFEFFKNPVIYLLYFVQVYISFPSFFFSLITVSAIVIRNLF